MLALLRRGAHQQRVRLTAMSKAIGGKGGQRRDEQGEQGVGRADGKGGKQDEGGGAVGRRPVGNEAVLPVERGDDEGEDDKQRQPGDISRSPQRRGG